MAPLKITGCALAAATLVAACATYHSVVFAQDVRDSATDRVMDTALQTGDFHQAAIALERLAKSGNAEAQYQLASFYRAGRGVPQDDALAFKWMKASAEQQHMRAQFNLGSMYLTGRGVPRDIATARLWLGRAAARGYGEAARMLQNLPVQQSANVKDSAAAGLQAEAASEARSSKSRKGVVKALVAQDGRPLILEAAIRGQDDAIRQLSQQAPISKPGTRTATHHLPWPRLSDSFP